MKFTLQTVRPNRVGSNRTDRIELFWDQIELFCQFDVPRNCEYQKWLVFLNGFSVFFVFFSQITSWQRYNLPNLSCNSSWALFISFMSWGSWRNVRGCIFSVKSRRSRCLGAFQALFKSDSQKFDLVRRRIESNCLRSNRTFFRSNRTFPIPDL